MCASFYCKSLLATFVIFLVLFSPGILSWKPTPLTRDVLVWRFVIWRHRAFFAIPRWKNESIQMPPTLLETFWHDKTHEILPSAPFENTQDEKALRSVCGLDVDPRGRLWVLDAPREPERSARVIVYDLKRIALEEIASVDLLNVPTEDLKVLVVDPVPNPYEYRAYIGDPGDESIIVYSLGERRWWRLRMEHNYYLPRIYSSDLAISKRNSLLYATGSSTDDLFSINLAELRNCQGTTSGHEGSGNQKAQKIKVSWVGKKLGRSTGLFCDAKGGVHYFLISESASVRWDSRYELKAENHLILLQNETLSCITDYATDFQKNIWGLVNPECPFPSKLNSSIKSTLGPRIIKVYKYNCLY